MSTNLSVCNLSEDALKLLKEFKFRKEQNIAAIVLKIDKASMKIVVEEELSDISIEDLQEEVTSQQPRYIALSYVQKHDDGRVSYPLFFIFVSPSGCSPEQQMMYASSKTKAVSDGDFTKVMELRNLEDLTEEAILDRLKRFK